MESVTSSQDYISLSTDTLSESAIINSVKHPSCGAVCTFLGTTRDNFQGKRVTKLWYEAYESLALKSMRSIAEEARSRFIGGSQGDGGERMGIAIVHRLGDVPVGETSIVIAVSSAHRKKSFETCEWILEKVKKETPIWKREYYEGGEVLRARDGQSAEETGTLPVWKENFPS
ncbi:Molybdopterin synthase catalytic subunit [Atractiella rhizophila]|nr:Molybdopterin synthase catalytic subunit [Atractiella rhizophila]